MRKLLSVVLLSCSVLSLFAQLPDRYYDKIFGVDVTRNIPFGSSVKFNGDTLPLTLDIYQPQNDTLAERPLIILAFGGSFTFGTKLSPDITRLCDEFAKRGYITASIDYRLGFENNNDSDTNQLKALFRGIQDLQAAIRFFYKDRQTANSYRVDTQQIFIGGVSAGAFMSLNHAYYKETVFSNPPPPWVVDALNEIHWFDGNSGNPGYSTKVKGVINLCGALADTIWLQPGDPILVSVHGTADDLVPYKFDSAQAAQSVEAMLYGSFDIHERANRTGITNSLRLFSDAGHAPFVFPKDFTSAGLAAVTRYMDSTIWVIRDFLYANIDRKDWHTSIAGITGEWNMQVYPNPASDFVSINIETVPGSRLQLVFTDLTGRQRLLLDNIRQQPLMVRKEELGSGVFIIQLRDAATGNILRAQTVIFSK